METRPNTTPLRTSSKTTRFSLILASCAVIAGYIGTQGATAGDAVRVTTSFDVKYAGAVLRQVSRVFGSGFGQSEANRVEQEINGLKPDQPRVWKFNVQYHGNAEQFEVRALMDDLGMIDLDFAAGPDAAPAVRAAVDGYLNGRGG